MYSVNQLFSSIQNGQQAQKSIINLPKTKIAVEILNILLAEGYILGYAPSYKLKKNSKLEEFSVFLKYKNGEPLIKRIRQISSSGKRVYFKSKKIQELSSFDFLILSTPKGLMTNQKASSLGIGGEAFCQIY
jgi:small subunit ribosomal protein S8